jgi:predicted metal-dependent peptidase
MQLNLKDRLIKAAVQLNDQHPFFAYMVLHLNDGGEIDFNEKIPSAGIDARGHLQINPKWADQFDYPYLMGLLAHEVGHLAFGHLLRTGRRIPEIFNMANDIEINNMLVKNGFRLPQDGIIPQNDMVDLYKDGKIVIKDISQKHSEEIYDELYRKLDKNGMIQTVIVSGYGTGKGGGGKGKKKGPKSFDSHTYGDALPDKVKKQTAQKWRDRVVEGTTIAKQKGNVPAGMDRLIDKILNPHLTWRPLLWKYVQKALPYDFTWLRPSKKSYSTGIYMPSTLRENIYVVVAVDTSGSISQKELTTFLNEIVSIGRSFVNVEIRIIICDADIHEVYTLKNGDIPTILKLKVSGGGGTSHEPVVKYINDKLPTTKVLITFTDGYSDIESCYPKLPEGVNNIIVLAGYSVPEKEMRPFGHVVKIDSSDIDEDD